LPAFQVQSDRRVQALDVTASVEEMVAAARVGEGLCVVSASHTTVALIVNEYVPDLMRDLERWIEQTAPAGSAYDHPGNADSHLRAALFGSSVTLPVADGGLALGRWQSVILLEFDGPRRRTVNVQVVGS
jgi:secondary thiamine-phosphate synthase enzyme